MDRSHREQLLNEVVGDLLDKYESSGIKVSKSSSSTNLVRSEKEIRQIINDPEINIGLNLHIDTLKWVLYE